MKLLVSGCQTVMRELFPKYPDHLGVLVIPRAYGVSKQVSDMGGVVAMDNFAFSNFEEVRYYYTAKRLKREGVNVRWVAVPDVVGDCNTTEVLWHYHSAQIAKLGLVPALVLQDGITPADVRRLRPKAVFIGGTTRFKLSPDIRELVRASRSAGAEWVHMGRVSSEKRFRFAYGLGCDSVDGSRFSRWPSLIEDAVGWLQDIKRPRRTGFFI